jgi:hypothetical protein
MAKPGDGVCRTRAARPTHAVSYGQFAEIMRTDSTFSVLLALAELWADEDGVLLEEPAAPLPAAPVEPEVAPVEPEVAPVEPDAPAVDPAAPVEPDAPAAPLLRSIEALALARPVTWTRCPTCFSRSEVLPLRRQVAAPELAELFTPAEPLAAVLPAAPDAGVDAPAPADPVALVEPLEPEVAPLPAADPVVPVAPDEDEPLGLLALAEADGAALDMTLVSV